MNNEVSVYTFITLLYFKILVKSLIKSKWLCGSVDTHYTWPEDVKLSIIFICKKCSNLVIVPQVPVIGVTSMTSEDVLNSTFSRIFTHNVMYTVFKCFTCI